MPNPQPRTLSFLGFAKETTPGTYVAPTDYMPVRDLKPHDLYHYVPDENLRGSMVREYDQVATQAWSEYEFGGDVFVDKLGFPLLSLLGEQAVSGAGPYTHTFDVLNTAPGQPPTLSLTDYNGFNARGYPFFVVDEMAFKWSADQLVTYSAKGKGFKGAVQSTPTPSFSAEVVKPAWTGATTLNSVSTSVQSTGELTIRRMVDPILVVSGAQDPYKIWAGAVEAEGKMSLIFQDDTHLAFYTAGTRIPIDVSFDNGVVGAGQRQLKFHATSALVIDAVLNRGKQYLELDVSFRAVANTTDVGASGGYSPCKVTLINSRSAIY